MSTADKPLHPALRRNGSGITADGEFYMPTRALFGRGIAGQTPAHVTAFGAKAVLLVTDPGVRAAGLVAPVKAALTDARQAVANDAERLRQLNEGLKNLGLDG